jgi:hypothetical protein
MDIRDKRLRGWCTDEETPFMLQDPQLMFISNFDDHRGYLTELDLPQ